MKFNRKTSRRSLKKKNFRRTRKNVKKQSGGYKYDSISFTVNKIKFEKKSTSSFFSRHEKVNIATPLTFQDIRILLSMYNPKSQSVNMELINNLIKFVIKLYGYYSYLNTKDPGQHTHERKTNVIDNIYILLYILSIIYNQNSKLFTIFLQEKKEECDQTLESMNSILCILNFMVANPEKIAGLFRSTGDKEETYDMTQKYESILSDIDTIIETKIKESVEEVNGITIYFNLIQNKSYFTGVTNTKAGDSKTLEELKSEDEIRIIALFKLFLDSVYKTDKTDSIYQSLISPGSLGDMNSKTNILILLLTVLNTSTA